MLARRPKAGVGVTSRDRGREHFCANQVLASAVSRCHPTALRAVQSISQPSNGSGTVRASPFLRSSVVIPLSPSPQLPQSPLNI